MLDAEHRILRQEAPGSLLRRRWVKVEERRVTQRLQGVVVVRVLLTAAGGCGGRGSRLQLVAGSVRGLRSIARLGAWRHLPRDACCEER